MFGLGKLFGRKNRNRAQEDGTVNPAARTQEGAPAAAPRPQMGQMQSNYLGVVQSLRAKQSSAGGESAASAPASTAPAPAASATPAPASAEPVPQAEAAQSIEAAAEAMQAAGPQPMSAKAAGLICLTDLYAKSGLTGEEELPPQAQAMIAALSNYHEFMDTRVLTIDHFREKDDHRPEVQVLDAVIRAGNAMVAGFKGKNKKSSAYTALMPGVSQLLIQAYQLMPMIAGMDRILVPYIFATHNDQVSVAQLIESPQAKALMGAMSSIAAQDGVPRDGGAEVMRLYGASANKRKNAKKKDRINEVTSETDLDRLGAASGGSVEAEANGRLFPSIDSASFIEDSVRLLQMLDDLSTKTSGKALYTHHEYLLVMKLLSQALASPSIQAMCSHDVDIATVAQQDASEEDAALVERLRQAAGKTVGSLTESFTDFMLSEGQITPVSQDSFATGGMLSATFIDKANNAVFRASKAAENATAAETLAKQKKAFNGSYDEAMSKLDEALGLGMIAKAEVAAYKNKTGEALIGSKMELVKGSSMLSYMEKAKKNGTEGVNVDNPRLMADYLRLAVVDYIAMHTDRNRGNYMYNPDAGPDEPMIKGIDNDMVFNMSPGEDFGQGVGSRVNVNEMITDRNAGQANMLRKTSVKNKYRRQGRQLQHLGASLTAFNIITPEIKEIVMNIDSKKINDVLRPYVNVTARLAALERIEELQTYVSNTSQVVDLYKKDGSVDEENMKIHQDSINQSVMKGLLASAIVRVSDGKINCTLMLSGMAMVTGSSASNLFGDQKRDEALAFFKQGRKSEQIKKFMIANGVTVEDLYNEEILLTSADDRLSFLEQVNAMDDDFETQQAKIKAYVMSQSMDDIVWNQMG